MMESLQACGHTTWQVIPPQFQDEQMKQSSMKLSTYRQELNQEGQYTYCGKVVRCLVPGNEEGVTHCAISVLCALQHLGYSMPRQADAGGDNQTKYRPTLSGTSINQTIKPIRKLVAVVLSLLAIVLLVMGIGDFMIPPALIGIGFLGIAFVLFKKEGHNSYFDK